MTDIHHDSSFKNQILKHALTHQQKNTTTKGIEGIQKVIDGHLALLKNGVAPFLTSYRVFAFAFAAPTADAPLNPDPTITKKLGWNSHLGDRVEVCPYEQQGLYTKSV